MTPVAADVSGSGYLRPDAKQQYDALDAAFRSRFGKSLRITEAYRPFARQDALFRERYYVTASGIYYDGQYWTKLRNASVAAVPGTSNHGWGTACDFGAGVNVGGSAENNWMDANAPAFGYNPTVPSEPWHFDYTRAYQPAPTTPAPEKEEDEDMKPRMVRVNDASSSTLNGLVAFLFPDRAVRTKTSDEIYRLGRAWGLLAPGQKWETVVDEVVAVEYSAAETEINANRTLTRNEIVAAIKA